MTIYRKEFPEPEIPETRIQPPRKVKKKRDKIEGIVTGQLSHEQVSTRKKRKIERVFKQEHTIDLTGIYEHCPQEFKDLFISSLVKAESIPVHIRESVELLKSVVGKHSLEGLLQPQVEKILEAATFFQIHSLRKEAINSLIRTIKLERLPALFLLAKNNSCPEILLRLIASDNAILDHPEFPQEFFNNFNFMREVVITYPPAVYLVGESLKENPKPYRILVMEALSTAILNGDNGLEKLFEWSKSLFPENGLPIKSTNAIADSIEKVLARVGDWEERPKPQQIEEVRSQIWDGIMELSHIQFITWVDMIRQDSPETLVQFIILPLHSLAFSLTEAKANHMAKKCVAFDPTDEGLVRWALKRNPRAILAANTSDPEFKELYLTQVKAETDLKPDIVTSPYFPKELFDDFDFMKKLLSENPFLHTYLGEKLQAKREELLLEAIKERFTSTLQGFYHFNNQGELLVEITGKVPIPFSEFRRKVLTSANISEESSLFHQKFRLSHIYLESALASYALENALHSRHARTKEIFSNIGENFTFTGSQAIADFSYLWDAFPEGELDEIIIHAITEGKVFLDAKVDKLTEYTSKEFAKSFLNAIVTDPTSSKKILLKYTTKNPQFIQSNDVLKYLLDDLDFVKKMLLVNPALHTYAGEKLRTERKAEFETAIVAVVAFKIQQEFMRANRWEIDGDGELTIQKAFLSDFITYQELLQFHLKRYGLEENALCKKLPLSTLWNIFPSSLEENEINWLICSIEVKNDIARETVQEIERQEKLSGNRMSRKIEYFEQHENEFAQLRTALHKKIFTYIGKNFVIGNRDQAQLLIPYLKLLFPGVEFDKVNEPMLAEATSPEFAHDFFSLL